MITKIISGGQTGAGRATLDVAIKLDIPLHQRFWASDWKKDVMAGISRWSSVNFQDLKIAKYVH